MNKEMMRESIGGACTEATEAGVKLGSGPEISAHCGKGDGAEPGLELGLEEPWPEAVDGQELLDGLEQLLRRFVVLPKWAAETSALWILHTYAFELRDVSTYLGIESPEKRCGKTTLLTVLSELVNRPVVAANISSPAFFRVIEEARPTLLIDEGDTFLRGNDDLRGILNCGYSRKTAYVLRVTQAAQGEEGQSSRLAKFSCWCPKVIATIGRLPDTLADRCILIRMQRKTGMEECERLRDLRTAELRRKCARFVRDAAEAIRRARAEIPAGLNDRAADIWEPLLVLADLAGGAWPERARQAAVNLTVTAQESNPIGALLFDIFIVFARGGAERMLSRELVASLSSLGERPWAELRQGRQITDIWLSKQLRAYGVRSKTMRMGEVVGRGYVEEDFQEVFRRYIPMSEVQELREELAGRRRNPSPPGT